MNKLTKTLLVTLASLLGVAITLAMALAIIDAVINLFPSTYVLISIVVGFTSWLVYRIYKTLD